MGYLTHQHLAESPGAMELGQTAADRNARSIEPELMDATLRGGDRSAWSADQVTAADRALARIDAATMEAVAVVDGYLARRYALPLASPPLLLITWTRAIVRYKLHGDRISDERTDPVVRDYRDATRLLELVAGGKFSLGLEDPTTGAGSLGEIQINPGHKVFGRENLP